MSSCTTYNYKKHSVVPMVNISTVSTCPLFPELENYKDGLDAKTGQLHIPGVFSFNPGSILPQGVGTGTITASYDVGYDASGWNNTAQRNYEFDLHEKYPALQQAWDHYQNVLKMCRSREEETDENRL